MPEPAARRRAFALATASLVIGLALALAGAEAVARWLVPDAYYVYPPGYEATFDPSPDVIPGVHGPSRLTINRRGIRGDPIAATQRYRLLAVGGSTTLCTYLGDAEAWPHRLQDRLDEALGAGASWVGNVGRVGHTTTQHALQVEKLLPQFPEIDGVILLVGLNDMLLQLAWSSDEGGPRPGSADPDAQIQRAFSAYPGADADDPWYRRSGIARLWRTRVWEVPEWGQRGPSFDGTGSRLTRWRRFRAEASSLRHDLPKLSAGLEGYARRLHRLVDAAAANDARLVFLTQPTIWRDDLGPDERERLWMGGPPLDRLRSGAVYYGVDALAEAMDRFNRRLLRVCRKRPEAECFDLASALPKDAAFFWDDAHFTERGAERVAELVADYLLSRAPLRSEAR